MEGGVRDAGDRAEVVAARDGGFWTILPNDLELRRFSPSGGFQGSIRIRGSVVEPFRERIPGEVRDVRPRPRHADIVELDEGRFLVLAQVSAQEWEAQKPHTVEGPFRPSMEDMNRIYSTVIQWVDRSTGQVRAARSVRELLRPVGGAPRLLYSVYKGDLGHAVTRLWRVSLSPPPGAGPGLFVIRDQLPRASE